VSTPKWAGPKKKESLLKTVSVSVRNTETNSRSAKGRTNAKDREEINLLKGILEGIMHDVGTDMDETEEMGGEAMKARVIHL
jgi:hypothetical protein